MSQTVSKELHRIARVAAENKGLKFRNLATRLTEELLHLAYKKLRKDGAAGVDKVTAEQYSADLERNIRNLHTHLKEQRYRAPLVRRSWIPKGDGKFRPLGIPTLEDKLVQKGVAMLLEPIYEKDFYDFSYGYRPGKKLHDTIEPIRKQCMKNGISYIIDADIKGYFENIDHKKLMEFLKQRVVDKSILRLIGKWLRAGILDKGQITKPESGTPQGGVISPLLANIYLHYVLDEWFVKDVTPRMKGRVFIIRVADDFIIGCEKHEDAKRVMEVIPKRMTKYGLTVQEEKTKLVDFSKPKGEEKKGKATFDFIGFRFYWGKTRKGKFVVKVKTSPKRIKRTWENITNWCKENRHRATKEQHAILSSKLRGHYNYYGVSFNYRALSTVRHHVERSWHKWLNRRGGKHISWNKWQRTIGTTFALPRPCIYHSLFSNPPRQLSFF